MLYDAISGKNKKKMISIKWFIIIEPQRFDNKFIAEHTIKKTAEFPAFIHYNTYILRNRPNEKKKIKNQLTQPQISKLKKRTLI